MYTQQEGRQNALYRTTRTTICVLCRSKHIGHLYFGF